MEIVVVVIIVVVKGRDKDVRPAKAKEHSLKRFNHSNFQGGPKRSLLLQGHAEKDEGEKKEEKEELVR